MFEKNLKYKFCYFNSELFLQAAGIALLCIGLWMKISLHYLLELSDEYNEAIPYIFIGTGAVILIVGFFACCCTVKGQPVLLYIVSTYFEVNI